MDGEYPNTPESAVNTHTYDTVIDTATRIELYVSSKTKQPAVTKLARATTNASMNSVQVSNFVIKCLAMPYIKARLVLMPASDVSSRQLQTHMSTNQKICNTQPSTL